MKTINEAFPHDNQGLSVSVFDQKTTSIAESKLNMVMRDAGWELNHFDIDLTTEMPKVEIRVTRNDGRYLIAKVDALGRASFETFQRERFLRMDTKGRRPLSPIVDDKFLGRKNFSGARSMLRNMTAYLSDNALIPVALTDMRSAWAGVMSNPQKQGQIHAHGCPIEINNHTVYGSPL